MLIKEEIGEDSIVYMDVGANGKDLVFKMEKNEVLVNGTADPRFEILNQKPLAQKKGEDQDGEGNGKNGETTPLCSSSESDDE